MKFEDMKVGHYYFNRQFGFSVLCFKKLEQMSPNGIRQYIGTIHTDNDRSVYRLECSPEAFDGDHQESGVKAKIYDGDISTVGGLKKDSTFLVSNRKNMIITATYQECGHQKEFVFPPNGSGIDITCPECSEKRNRGDINKTVLSVTYKE